MKQKRVALILFGVLLLCLAFSLGYLLGHGNGETVITMNTVAPSTEPAVMTQPETYEAPVDPSDAPPTPENPLDLNTATRSQLEQLPGIGPELAGRILAYRQEFGRFVAKEQIMDVEGIGEKRFEEMEPLITVGGTQ